MVQPSLPPEIRNLPVADRLQLVDQIWDSIVQDEKAFELSDAQKRTLDQRIAEHEKTPDRGVPWDAVKKRLLGE